LNGWSLASGVLSVAAIATLVLPLCGAVIALLCVRSAHHLNTVRILGWMFVSTACGLALIGAVGALLRGEQPVWPYLVLPGLPAVSWVLHPHDHQRRTDLNG
jgi:hypothetical protein